MIARYELVWFLLALVAIANGVLREASYANHLSELSAHQVSTVIGAFFSGLLITWKQEIYVGAVGNAQYI